MTLKDIMYEAQSEIYLRKKKNTQDKKKNFWS